MSPDDPPLPRLAVASCCHALVLPHLKDPAGVEAWVRSHHAFAAHPVDAESFRFLQSIEPLPDRWEDWPEASKLACPPELLGPSRRYRCKLIGPDGLCSIYGRRTYVCSAYKPSADSCVTCQWFKDGACSPTPSLKESAS